MDRNTELGLTGEKWTTMAEMDINRGEMDNNDRNGHKQRETEISREKQKEMEKNIEWRGTVKDL